MSCQSPGEGGEALAKTHCGGCHLYPEPGLLPKKTWKEGVLPKMALRLGMLLTDTTSINQQIAQYEELEQGKRQGFLPAQAVVTPTEWQQIVAFYLDHAPDSLIVNVPAPTPSLTLFKPITPARPLPPGTTCLRIDTVGRRIWVADQWGGLTTFDARLNRTDSTFTNSPLTDMVRIPGQAANLPNPRIARLWVGSLSPNDFRNGRLDLPGQPSPDKLRRPIQLTPADLNRDGQTDWVVCQFGHNVGRLSAYLSAGRTHREVVLDPAPGARRAIVRDCNADGRPDVLALMTQGDEQVAVYYQQPDGSFRKETLLRFPPVHGSSYIELADMNADGHVDIVYTNGDNADYSPIPKPYHGLHIYLNDGHFRFHKRWTYPMPGASMAVARDFDLDGDADIAAIAYFPKLPATRQQPAQVFVYVENRGRQGFQVRTWPGADRGSWLVMDANDVDGDGDDDIVLGSLHRGQGAMPAAWDSYWAQQPTGLVLLQNQVRP
jgi:hypothetical protein